MTKPTESTFIEMTLTGSDRRLFVNSAHILAVGDAPAGTEVALASGLRYYVEMPVDELMQRLGHNG